MKAMRWRLEKQPASIFARRSLPDTKRVGNVRFYVGAHPVLGSTTLVGDTQGCMVRAEHADSCMQVALSIAKHDNPRLSHPWPGFSRVSLQLLSLCMISSGRNPEYIVRMCAPLHVGRNRGSEITVQVPAARHNLLLEDSLVRHCL